METARRQVTAQLRDLGLREAVTISEDEGDGVGGDPRPRLEVRLRDGIAREWTPDHDTTGLCRRLGLRPDDDDQDLEKEILVAMLAGPVSFEFPTPAELACGVRIRRNPDSRSSDIKGYEGSWVFYLGNGLFTNFWKRNQPYTLTSKCVEIFHWADAATVADGGGLWMDEERVDALVQETLKDPARTGEVLSRMQRYREPSGVYVEGGCIDTTREGPRWVCPGTADLVLPPAVVADA
jgi:hypothetical protein